MSGTDLAAILLIAGVVMFVMSYWREIVFFLLFVILTAFCVGIYYLTRQLHM